MALIVGFGFAVAHRTLVELDVLRDRNALYREVDGAHIENVYTIRLINKDTKAHEMRLTLRDFPQATIDGDQAAYVVGAGEVVSAAVRIRAPSHTVSGGRDIELVASATDADIESVAEARFIAPVRR
jgi:polyferredoxin